jgi:hypothetical protein
MVGLIFIAVFVLVWIWIFYQVYIAPELDENHKIIKKKDDSLDLDFKNDEFLN